jgi:predicted nucleic acid-binding protein
MRYVLDSCAAVKWFLSEPDSAKAIQLRDEFDQQVHELLAPDVFPVEVAHALSRAERRGLIQCRLQPKRAPLWETTGYHLGGCSVSCWTTLMDQASWLGWLASVS